MNGCWMKLYGFTYNAPNKIIQYLFCNQLFSTQDYYQVGRKHWYNVGGEKEKVYNREERPKIKTDAPKRLTKQNKM